MTVSVETAGKRKPRGASHLLATMRARGMGRHVDDFAAAWKVLPIELFERNRTKRVAAARKSLWQHLRTLGWSYTEIADAFGRTRAAVTFAFREAGRGTA